MIDPDFCTGCQACVDVCPVQCIHTISVGRGVKGLESWCEVDLERCIGCRWCVRLPRRPGDPHQVTVCPWEAIRMAPVERLEEAVAALGGGAEARARRTQWLEAARRLVRRRATRDDPPEPP